MLWSHLVTDHPSLSFHSCLERQNAHPTMGLAEASGQAEFLLLFSWPFQRPDEPEGTIAPMYRGLVEP
jgi:hypothetical protein